jgi:hypothetical protein
MAGGMLKRAYTVQFLAVAVVDVDLGGGEMVGSRYIDLRAKKMGVMVDLRRENGGAFCPKFSRPVRARGRLASAGLVEGEWRYQRRFYHFMMQACRPRSRPMAI